MVSEGFRNQSYPLTQAEAILKTLQVARGKKDPAEDGGDQEQQERVPLWPWQQKSPPR